MNFIFEIEIFLYILVFVLLASFCIISVVNAIKSFLFWRKGECETTIFEKDGKRYRRIYGKPAHSSWGEVFIEEIDENGKVVEQNHTEEKEITIEYLTNTTNQWQ